MDRSVCEHFVPVELDCDQCEKELEAASEKIRQSPEMLYWLLEEAKFMANDHPSKNARSFAKSVLVHIEKEQAEIERLRKENAELLRGIFKGKIQQQIRRND